MPEGLVRGTEQGEYLWQKDSSVMVYVSSGTFTMGTVDGEPDEGPAHEVWLDGFYIDKYELSWAQYKRSGAPVDSNRHSRLPQAFSPDWGIVDTQPVLNVNWHDAQTYVAWAGKRLPTEAEWEKAARGVEGRTYPWGNDEPTFERAIWQEHPTAATSTADVTCCQAGASPYGVLNMAGNVYEWVADTYESRYYARAPHKNPVNRGEGKYRSLRGGAFVLPAEDLRSAYRYRLLPQDRTPYIGFRAALSATAPADASMKDVAQGENDP
jgi:formylglycine-generating enzyme required for sulfatase activity